MNQTCDKIYTSFLSNEMRRLGMNRILRYFLLYGLIFLAIMGIFSSLNNTNPEQKEIRYDEFITALEDGKVTTVSLQPVQLVLEVKGTMKGYEDGEEFVTNIMNDTKTQEDIRALATQTQTEINILPTPVASAWVSFFTGLLPFIIIFILFFFLLN